MTQEEQDKIVEEAKFRYPIGTKFTSSMYPDKNNSDVVKSTSFYWWKTSDLCADSPGGTSVWTNGRWAEILFKPEPTIINNYQIY